MTTNAVVYLEKGGRKLDLNSGRYSVADDFVPPLVAITPLLASGTSANTHGGARLISKRATNRSWSFGLHVAGVSTQENARALGDINVFLGWAGDESEPVYLVYDPNSDVSAEPLWGQRRVRYEVVFGQASLSPLYGVFNARAGNLPNCQVFLQVKPYAIGKKQRLALASGGVNEDVYGSPNGLSRGITVSEVSPTGGNEFTNPVFGNSTWDTGWTADASLAAEQNTDPRFCLPGTTSSARLTSRATNQEFYDAINTGDTNTHAFSCYAKLPDGGAVSSTHVVLFYSTALTTTFTSVGDGWYRLTATATGINASTNTGVQVKNGYTVYVSGFQMEQAAYSTPLFYGDLLGCAWSGTAHDSVSTRAVGVCKVPISSDTFHAGALSVRLVIKFWCDNTFSGDIALFDSTNGSATAAPHLYYSAAADDFRMDMGGVSIDSGAQTFSVGDVVVLHFTGDETNGVAIYKNGASVASSASFNPAVLGSYFFIGSNYDSTAIGPITIMDCTTWDVGLTAAEVLADYTTVAPLADHSERVGAIPYLWTKDGDGIVDNCDGSVSGTGRDNYCVVNGIPGSAPAITLFDLRLSDTLTSFGNIYMSNNAFERFYSPGDWSFFDKSGTADVGNSSGDAYISATADTTGLNGITIGTVAETRALEGREVYILFRLYDAGSSEVDYILTTPWQNYSNKITATTAMRLWSLQPFVWPTRKQTFKEHGLIDSVALSIALDRTTGSASVRVDFFALLPRPLFVIDALTASANQGVIIQGKDVAEYVTTTYEFTQTEPASGDIIEFEPNKYNILLTLAGDTTNTMVVTNTITYYRVIVTPRYALL